MMQNIEYVRVGEVRLNSLKSKFVLIELFCKEDLVKVARSMNGSGLVYDANGLLLHNDRFGKLLHFFIPDEQVKKENERESDIE